jgi:DNA-directed RNA polymerase specialized sigma24 family protein
MCSQETMLAALRAYGRLQDRDDLTHREISLVMQISEPAAHRNVFESLKQLRKGTQR